MANSMGHSVPVQDCFSFEVLQKGIRSGVVSAVQWEQAYPAARMTRAKAEQATREAEIELHDGK